MARMFSRSCSLSVVKMRMPFRPREMETYHCWAFGGSTPLSRYQAFLIQIAAFTSMATQNASQTDRNRIRIGRKLCIDPEDSERSLLFPIHLFGKARRTSSFWKDLADTMRAA